MKKILLLMAFIVVLPVKLVHSEKNESTELKIESTTTQSKLIELKEKYEWYFQIGNFVTGYDEANRDAYDSIFVHPAKKGELKTFGEDRLRILEFCLYWASNFYIQLENLYYKNPNLMKAPNYFSPLHYYTTQINYRLQAISRGYVSKKLIEVDNSLKKKDILTARDGIKTLEKFKERLLITMSFATKIFKSEELAGLNLSSYEEKLSWLIKSIDSKKQSLHKLNKKRRR